MVKINKQNITIITVLGGLFLVFSNKTLDYFIREYGWTTESLFIGTLIIGVTLWGLTR